jgi:hypothetical protein
VRGQTFRRRTRALARIAATGVYAETMSASLLKPFGSEIWLADGPQTSVVGFRYPTRMAVVRLRGGALLVWSPVALTDRLQVEVDRLGVVRHLLAPKSLHHLFLAQWRTAYPRANVHAAPGLAGKLRVTELGDTPAAAWVGDLDQVVVRGNRITTEVVFFHRPSGAVLFTDLIQHFPPDWFQGWRALVARLDLMTGPEPTVPRKFGLAFTDRAAARLAVRRILGWPARKVIFAHGAPVESDAPAFLARAFAWLAA